ncbi:hypothetical protein BHM03_00022785 [Ensete ventricosum]|nr:hypothetical protein BHM03_00022785 [Ensete ventricosum]
MEDDSSRSDHNGSVGRVATIRVHRQSSKDDGPLACEEDGRWRGDRRWRPPRMRRLRGGSGRLAYCCAMAERRWWFGWRRVQRQRFSLKQYEKGEEWRRFSRWQISLSYSKPYLEREKMRKCERRRRGNDFGVC